MQTAVGAVRQRPEVGEEQTFWRALRDPRMDRAAAIAARGSFAGMIHHGLLDARADLPR